MDYILKRYEIYPILALVLLKMFIQYTYPRKDKYDKYKEYPQLIMDILVNEYGSHIAHEISLFLPIFYDQPFSDNFVEIELQANQFQHENQTFHHSLQNQLQNGDIFYIDNNQNR